MELAQKVTDEEKVLSRVAKNGRPTSLIVKKAHTLIPAHILAEIISQPGLDLRWSRPGTLAEIRYVEQYILAKYPMYANHKTDLYVNLCIKEEPSLHDEKRTRPRGVFEDTSESNFEYLERIQLLPSRLLHALTTKCSYKGSFVSVPEIQAQNKVLDHCELPADEYLVLFSSSYSDAMMLVAESYPFIKGIFYLPTLDHDQIGEFARIKEAKVIKTNPSWLNLRITGSQLSQCLRRKSYRRPKGLFSFPANVSMHWISEAHRNSWNVLVDATSVVMGEGTLKLAHHRPDFVLCNPDSNGGITCLLVRKKSFEITTPEPLSS